MTSDTYRILIVDDNPSIHRDFRTLFGRRRQESDLDSMSQALFGDIDETPAEREPDYLIDSVYQGEDALEAVSTARAEGRPYALVFMDIRMPPGLDGVETTRKLLPLDPDLNVVLCSAHSDYTWTQFLGKFGLSARLSLLRKPIDPDTLRMVAASLTLRWDEEHEMKQRMDEMDKQLAQLQRAQPTVCTECGALLSQQSPQN